MQRRILTGNMNPTSSISGSNSGVWIVVEEGELKGMTLITDRESGDIVGLSSRSCSNEQMRSSMPSLSDNSNLKVIDLHNYRYIRNLHESVTDLQFLERLILCA